MSGARRAEIHVDERAVRVITAYGFVQRAAERVERLVGDAFEMKIDRARRLMETPEARRPIAGDDGDLLDLEVIDDALKSCNEPVVHQFDAREPLALRSAVANG